MTALLIRNRDGKKTNLQVTIGNLESCTVDDVLKAAGTAIQPNETAGVEGRPATLESLVRPGEQVQLMPDPRYG